ncbi:GIY-YIG catalytic domain protein [compost metagenome]
MNSGVYLIRNTLNGKEYVGSSVRLRRRFVEHRYDLRRGEHQNAHLQSAWNKYGESAFEFRVILICMPKDARGYEQRWIDTHAPEYNKSVSAFSGIPFGHKISDETKEKIGLSTERLWATDEYRAKVTQAIRAAMTEGECEARSERAKNLWADSEYRAKAVEARKGNAHAKGHKCTPEQVENRKRAARISNMKRNYGDSWKVEYVRRYPEHGGDVDAQ